MHFWRAVVEWVEHFYRQRHRRHHHHHKRHLCYITARLVPAKEGPPCHSPQS